MKLYHYTARHHLDGGPGHAGPGILRYGLLPNVHPYIDVTGLVWLTDDPCWEQPWSTRPVPGMDCDRTEVRVEVVLPKASRRLLKPWRDVRPLVLTEGMADDLERFADPSRWFLFVRRVPPGWIRRVETRP